MIFEWFYRLYFCIIIYKMLHIIHENCDINRIQREAIKQHTFIADQNNY